MARQEASTILEEAKGRVTAAEREATTIEGEVAALRARCAAEASTHDARVAEACKATAALEKDAEAWAGRAKASREECERAERDLSDLRDQNAAQSTALIKATDTAQADRASRPVWKSKLYGASTTTPSTRRLLDCVAVPAHHRSTEPAWPRHR